MLLCDYSHEVEGCKVRLIIDRAKRLGFGRDELPDVQQEVILDVMRFQFDPARSNGATEVTALRGVIDRRLRAIRRARPRYDCRLQKFQAARGPRDAEDEYLAPDPIVSLYLAADVRQALATLAPEDRSLAAALAAGQSLRHVAAEQGCSWGRVQRQVTRIRRHFEALGLEGWLCDVE